MIISAACGLAALVALATPAFAEECRLALVMALDVSSSVDAQEDKLQREGLAHSLLAPEVVRAFLIGAPVALYVFEWSDASTQMAILPGWQMIRSEGDLMRVANAIADSEAGAADRSHVRTATGAALLHAAIALGKAPPCEAQTVDVSSDGESNDGTALDVAFAAFSSERVTVNALIVAPHGADEGSGVARHRFRHHRQLVGWFEREVLRGPGSFCISAEGYEDYERAMRAKLLRELEPPLVAGLLLAREGT